MEYSSVVELKTVHRYFALVAVLFAGSLARAEDRVREFSIIVEKPDFEYSVDAGGTMEPENVEVIVENLGETPLVNPRLTVNGLYDWYDAKALADEITRDCRTDEEKALAIWWWVLYKRFQRSPQDRSALHPVRAMNGYGYGICGHTSAWMKCLWRAAGLNARVQELWGHTVSEAYYNGAWHMLDGNVKVFYLDRDNRSIASLATLERDQRLIERTIHPRDPWFRGPDTPEHNRELVRYLVTSKDNYEEENYDGEIAKDYSMAMTLRPGERLVRWWNPVLGKFEGRHSRPEAPQRYANGQLIWEPDLRRIDLMPYLSAPSYGNITTQIRDGRGPAVHVADLQDELHTRPSVFSIPFTSPYPILGGRLSCTLVKEGNSSLDAVSIYYGKPEWGSGDLYNYRWYTGPQKVDLDLDSRISRTGVVYDYSIGFSLRGNAGATPPTQAGLDAFRVETDLQVSPHSLPALSLGRNTVRLRHQSMDPVRVRITHRWKEIHDRHAPGRVSRAVDPPDGGGGVSLDPVLSWTPAVDADPADRVADYQVMVSLRSDCRWPLSPTLYQNVGSEKTEWKVPGSFLNSGATYYWKVRARDTRGDIGEWSNVFRFTTR